MTMAKRAGVLYLLFSIIAIVTQFALPRFVVPADPAATLRAIAAAESSYRVSILLNFATLIFHVLVVASLYELLKRVDAWYALLMVMLVGVGVSVALANLLHRLVPLVALGGSDALTAIPKPELDALAFAALRLQGLASGVVLMFWGLWLFPFGILVYKSGFIPRIFGVLLLVAGIGYVMTSVTSIAWPAYRQTIAPYATALYVGELPIIFWLLLKGRDA
jgi:hypothetical protein